MDIIIASAVLFLVMGLFLWLIYGKCSQRDMLASEFYSLNYPFMDWETAYQEADFWMEYNGKA